MLYVIIKHKEHLLNKCTDCQIFIEYIYSYSDTKTHSIFKQQVGQNVITVTLKFIYILHTTINRIQNKKIVYII